MFTGIVTDVGTIESVSPLKEGIKLRVATSYDPATIDMGASISHSGICLTVTGLPAEGSNGRWFEVEAWEEALRLTTIGTWKEGSPVNLERSLKIGDELGGHIVSGHVDGKAEILSVTEEGDATRYRLRAPEHLAKVRRAEGLDCTRWHIADGQLRRRHGLRRPADPPHPGGHDLGQAPGRRFRQFRSRYHGALCR
jgi:riboflavin synthase